MSKKNKAKEISSAAAPQKKVDSRVEHPSYYNAHPSGVECIDIVAASRLLRELLNTEGKAESEKGGR